MKSIVSLAALPLALVLLCAHAGCSSDETPSGNQADAGASNDAATSGDATVPPPNDAGAADSASGACTELVNAGTQVVESAGIGTRPTPAGGTLEDGVYVLTKHEVYSPSSPDANTRKRTWKFVGGKVEIATDDAASAPVRASGGYTTSNNEIAITVSCPQATSVALPYTASGSTLIMFDKASQNDVFTYTKQ